MNFRLVSALLSLVLLPAVSSSAAPGAPPAPPSIADVYREAASTGSLTAVTNLLGSTAFPAAERAAALPPSDLAGAIDGLAFAVRRADAVVRRAVPADRRPQVLRAIARTFRGGVRPGEARAVPWVERAALQVDLPGMVTATRAIAAAVDVLLAAPLPSQLPHGTGACDVLDQAPLLCVSGVGEQTYTADRHWITVDLGGNDVYRNHVGVGACIGHPDDEEADPCVGVGVDLGGNDRYETPGLLHACEGGGFGPTKGICAQGAGMLGIGMLVDAEGDDSYSVDGKPKGEAGCLDTNFAICGIVDAQAAGRFGVGVLVDLGGRDAYSAAFPTPPENAPSDQNVGLIAQGTALFGAALLWDADGDDTYTVSGPATGYATNLSVLGWSNYSAQGVAVASDAIVLDEAGTDRFTIRARPGPGADKRTTKSPWGEGASSGLSPDNGGQGIGLSGFSIHPIGALITGKSDTVYDIDLGGRFQAQAHGQGDYVGGLLDDQGGHDQYRLAATVESSFVERCDCEEQASLELRFTHQRLTEGQGANQGRLIDRGGDDRYEVLTVGALSGRTESLREGVPAEVKVVGGFTTVSVQGIATGKLIDESGDDRYVVDARNVVTAEAVAEKAERVATANANGTSVAAQGVTGWLIDRGGLDHYEIRVRERGSALPERPGSVDDGALVVDGQGLAGDYGGITDVDAGELDVFSMDSPSLFDMCSGSYGSAPGWSGGVRRHVGSTTGPEQCSNNRARTTVTSIAPAGLPTTLRILSMDPVAGSDPAAMRVRVSLTDTAGAPVADAPVRIVPQALLGEPYYQIGPFHRWYNTYDGSRLLVTGADGVAEGTMLAPPCPPATSCTEPRRSTALYFGEAGIYQPSRDVRAAV